MLNSAVKEARLGMTNKASYWQNTGIICICIWYSREQQCHVPTCQDYMSFMTLKLLAANLEAGCMCNHYVIITQSLQRLQSYCWHPSHVGCCSRCWPTSSSDTVHSLNLATQCRADTKQARAKQALGKLLQLKQGGGTHNSVTRPPNSVTLSTHALTPAHFEASLTPLSVSTRPPHGQELLVQLARALLGSF